MEDREKYLKKYWARSIKDVNNSMIWFYCKYFMIIIIIKKGSAACIEKKHCSIIKIISNQILIDHRQQRCFDSTFTT